jgi:chromosomal replication initiation ATPase DnaA
MPESVGIHRSDEFAALQREARTIQRRLTELRQARAASHFADLTEIVEVDAYYYGVPVRALLGQRRERFIARPRQVAMYLARHLTEHSLGDLARFFRRDHSTVIHALQVVERLMADDPCLAEDVRTIGAAINLERPKAGKATPLLGQDGPPPMLHQKTTNTHQRDQQEPT